MATHQPQRDIAAVTPAVRRLPNAAVHPIIFSTRTYTYSSFFSCFIHLLRCQCPLQLRSAQPPTETTPPLAFCAAGRLSPVCSATQEKAEAKTEEASGAARQMLGMKGAALETDIWKIRVQLTKPVTWVPLIWGAQRLYLRFRADVSRFSVCPDIVHCCCL